MTRTRKKPKSKTYTFGFPEDKQPEDLYNLLSSTRTTSPEGSALTLDNLMDAVNSLRENDVIPNRMAVPLGIDSFLNGFGAFD